MKFIHFETNNVSTEINYKKIKKNIKETLKSCEIQFKLICLNDREDIERYKDTIYEDMTKIGPNNTIQKKWFILTIRNFKNETGQRDKGLLYHFGRNIIRLF